MTQQNLAVNRQQSGDTPEFVISRTVNAPCDAVWQAWTLPELMAKWWGPKGFTVGKYTMDFCPGGVYHYSMITPDGKEMWGRFVYSEIVRPGKLVFVNSFSDAEDNITRHPFSPHWPLEMLSTLTFAEENGKTTITVRWTPLHPTEQELQTFKDGMASMRQGWTGTFEQLEAYLENA